MLFSTTFIVSTLSLAAAQLSPYAPEIVECPKGFKFLRAAEGLSPSEAEWLSGKDKVTRKHVAAFLAGSGLENFTEEDAHSYVENNTIRIGVAISGGGYRAMLTGAGVLNAMDSRVNRGPSNSTGSLSGLLEASTYLAGLSSGSWLISSIMGNNFSTVAALQESEYQWEFSNLFEPVNTTGDDRTYWFETISQDIYEKRLSGFNTSLTDLWGLGLGAQLLGGSELNWGSNITWSSIAESKPFTGYDAPFPILVADHALSPLIPVELNSTVLEFTPFEVGSWDPSLNAFASTKYVGSPANNGTVDQCVNGLDNLAFTLASSSNLFNQPGYDVVGAVVSNALPVSQDVRSFDNFDLDIAIWNPNPFNGTDGADVITGEELLVADGGENGENVPFQPLIQPERGVDIIFAVDSSADIQSFPNGTSLAATFARQFTDQGNNVKFPYVPSPEEIVTQGLLERPTFLGVDAANLSSLWDPQVPESERVLPPVVVYLPNQAYTFPSNTSTLDLEFPNEARDAMIVNGEAIATQNGTVSDWRSCVACAIIVREQQRRGEQPSEQCQTCFQKYAWPPLYAPASSGTPSNNSTSNGTTPSGPASNGTALNNTSLLHTA